MAVVVVHEFESEKGDGVDDTLVQPSDWNAEHVVTGLGDAAEKNTGTTAGTVAAGDDSRITGAAQKSANLSDMANAATAFGNIKQAATAGATGVVELATPAEALTGTDTARAVTPEGVKAVADTKEALGKLAAIRTVTDNDTLVLADAGKTVEMNHASAKEFTIPPNSSVAFPLNTYINLVRIGAGALTIQGGTGVTLNGVSTGTVTIPTQYGATTIYKRGTDEWVAPNLTAS